MAPSNASAGVSKISDAKSKENKRKLQDLANGDLSDAKAQLANTQASTAGKENGRVADQEQPIQTQSKPEFPQETTNHSAAAESEDIDMGEASQSEDFASSSTSRSGASSSNTSDSDDEPELLADFQSLNLEGGGLGIVDGFGGKRRGRFFILRDGPRGAPKYQFKRTNACSTEGFMNLSDYRITLLKYDNGRGEKEWLYTKENVEGITGIAIEEREDTLREYKCQPQAWVKIRWRNIQDEHKNLLIKLERDDIKKRHSSWIPKSDLVRLVGRKAAEIKTSEAWDKQEARHLNYLKGTGRGLDRSPTPCPLDVFAAQKKQREGSRARSVTPQPLSRFDRTMSANATSAPLGSAIVKTEPLEPAIKEEPEDDDPDLFVQQNVSDRASVQPEVVNLETDQPGQKKRKPAKFSLGSYMKMMEKTEKWNRMSKEDAAKKRAEALANYDHYRDTRISLGDKEEEEED